MPAVVRDEYCVGVTIRCDPRAVDDAQTGFAVPIAAGQRPRSRWRTGQPLPRSSRARVVGGRQQRVAELHATGVGKVCSGHACSTWATRPDQCRERWASCRRARSRPPARIDQRLTPASVGQRRKPRVQETGCAFHIAIAPRLKIRLFLLAVSSLLYPFAEIANPWIPRLSRPPRARWRHTLIPIWK